MQLSPVRATKQTQQHFHSERSKPINCRCDVVPTDKSYAHKPCRKRCSGNTSRGRSLRCRRSFVFRLLSYRQRRLVLSLSLFSYNKNNDPRNTGKTAAVDVFCIHHIQKKTKKKRGQISRHWSVTTCWHLAVLKLSETTRHQITDEKQIDRSFFQREMATRTKITSSAIYGRVNAMNDKLKS